MGDTKRDDGWLDRVVDNKKRAFPSKEDIAKAEEFLSEPEAIKLLGFHVARVTDGIRMVQESGLTKHAICFLIQDLMPNLSNGSKPSLKLIGDVLTNAGRLEEVYCVERVVRPEEKKASRG